MTHIGIDLHSKASQVCELDACGDVVHNVSIPSTKEAYTRWFGHIEPSRIAVEATGSTPWVHALLLELGHDVLVLSPHHIGAITTSVKKTDANDAEVLARLLSLDRRFLRPVAPRTEQHRLVRAVLSCRGALVRSRTQAINTVRGLLRTWGVRVPGRHAPTFSKRVRELELPEEVGSELHALMEPVLVHIEHLSTQLAAYAVQLKALAKASDEARLLQTVPGVGPIVSLAFIGAIGDPQRFERSRTVPAYFGLVPRVRSSADVCTLGSITRRGDPELRRLLVQAAQVHLIHCKDSALGIWAEQLTARVGKRKAVVALARKLSILLHRMWVTGMVYDKHPTRPGKESQVSQRLETKGAASEEAMTMA